MRMDPSKPVAADAVTIHQGGASKVFAKDVRVRQGGIGVARSDSIHVSSGAVGAVLTRDATLEQTATPVVMAAKQARLEQAAGGVVVAESVHASQSAVGFLIARNVSGDVRVLFGPRGAFAFGAGVACVIGAARLIRKLLR